MANTAAVVTNLEALKAKVEETIAHVQSGVGNLNEDQVDQAEDMLQGLVAEARKTRDDSIPLLHDAETLIEKAEAVFHQLVTDVKVDLGIGTTTVGPVTIGLLTTEPAAAPAAVTEPAPEAAVDLNASSGFVEHPAPAPLGEGAPLNVADPAPSTEVPA
jgi:hypothetical protein